MDIKNEILTTEPTEVETLQAEILKAMRSIGGRFFCDDPTRVIPMLRKCIDHLPVKFASIHPTGHYGEYIVSFSSPISPTLLAVAIYSA